MNQEQNIKAISILVALALMFVGYLWLSAKSYKPVDLSRAPVIREFVFDKCEVLKDSIVVYTKPERGGVSGYLSPCGSYSVTVYREETHEGENWILFTASDLQGWQTSDIME